MYFMELNCTDRATLVAEQIAIRFTSKMANIDDDFQLHPCFNGLPSESLDDHTFEVEALVAGSKDDEEEADGTSIGSSARWNSWCVGQTRIAYARPCKNPDGYKLILLFLEKKGYKKDALDRRLLANRRYDAVARRPGQTLQDGICRRCESCFWD